MTALPRPGSGSSASGTSSGSPIGISSSAQTNDFAILAVTVQSSAAVVTQPSGWVQVHPSSGPESGSTDVVAYFKKFIGALDPGTNVTIAYTGATGVKWGAVMMCYSGVDATTPIEQFVTVLDTTTATSHTAPSITTANDNEQVVAILLERVSNQSTVFTTSSGPTIEESLIVPGTGAVTSDGFIADKGPITPAGAAGGWSMNSSATSFGKAFVALFALNTAAVSATVSPASDITTTSWVKIGVGSTFAALTSDTDDTTYAESAAAPAAQRIELKLGVAPAKLASVTVRLRISGGASSGSAIVSLIQNTTTVAGPWTIPSLTGSFVDYTNNTTSGEQAAQTDLTNLRVRIDVTAS